MSKKNLLLIGASGGLGVKILKTLRNEFNIAPHTNNNPEKLQKETTSKIYRADITCEDEVIKMIKEVEKDFGSIDILVNNAGLSINSVTWKTNIDDWHKVIAVNLTGPFLCTKHILPLMKKQNWGRIIYVSSVVPLIGVEGTASYASSKAGLTGLCKTVSREISKYNITANIISLGYFEAGLLYQIPEDIRKKIQESIPKGKFGDPDEFAECIRFLCSEKSSYLTGQSINLNGGLY